MAKFSSDEQAMIIIASIIAFFNLGAGMNRINRPSSVAGRPGGSQARFLSIPIILILHITILSIGINDGGDKTLFICYACWAWTYLFVAPQLSDVSQAGVESRTTNYVGQAQGLGALWYLAIFGTAIASAAYNTHHDDLDNNGLCIFGLVTTVLMFLVNFQGLQAHSLL